MAKIDLERKKRGGGGWLVGLAVLALLALVAWWIWPDTGDDMALDEGPEVVEPVGEGVGATEPPLTGELTLSTIAANPQGFVGQTFSGEVRVVDVPLDRGFWVAPTGAQAQQGQRVFALIVDTPQERPFDVQEGQTLRLMNATVRDTTFLPELSGRPLDSRTEQVAREQTAFLVVNEDAIQRMGAAADTAGNP